MSWDVVIGLEIHVQLATQSKLFSAAATAFGAAPNTQTSLVDLGMPGALPVVNQTAIRMAVEFGVAVNASIASCSVFARKNYFYPDLPKGYQISQMDKPIVSGGFVDLQLTENQHKRININRAHLEEDAGKSLHEDYQGMTGIDLNRAGTPLLEIVSEPEIESAEEAVAYMRKIHAIVTTLGISDGNMAQGSMRCDVNISVKPCGQSKLGTRTELKNINSFKFVEKAIHHEVDRQISLLEAGEQITQETRLYDADNNTTRSMRSKEEANDYRYFPCPDLLPIMIDADFIAAVRENLPELPGRRQARLSKDYGLNDYDAATLSADASIADYFEVVNETCADAKLAANWVMGEVSKLLNQHDMTIQDNPVKAENLGELLVRIKDQTISGNIARKVFQAMWDGEGTADEIIARKNLKQMKDAGAIGTLVEQVLTQHPEQVNQYIELSADKRKKMLGFFIGKIIKASSGKANPQQVNQVLKSKLDQLK